MKRFVIGFLVVIVLIEGFFYLKRAPQQQKHNVIFILVDTLRADHLGYGGYSRDTSPHIDALAKESVVFSNAFSASSWTAPSVASIFTGLYPSVHGMMPPNSRVKAAERFSFKLSDKVTTIAEVFKQAGYFTAGISSNEWIGEQFGYSQGFDYFYMSSRMIAEKVNERVNRVLDKLYKPDQPLYLYIHYIDPHDPYRAPEPYRNFFTDTVSDSRYPPEIQETIRDYDNEIRYNDEKIGELVKVLKEKGLYDNSYIVFTADHGEQFRERGHLGHGYTLFNEEVHIPLFIKFPGQAKVKKFEAPVSHVDILPSLAAQNGITLATKVNGIDLFSKAAEVIIGGRELLSEVSRKSNMKAAVNPGLMKTIAEYDLDKGLYVDIHDLLKIEAFDLRADPTEVKPLEAVGALQDNFFKSFENVLLNYERYKVDSLEMNSTTLEELKSLGYF